VLAVGDGRGHQCPDWSITDGNTDKAFYPGGGIEFNRGKWGIRAEGGDEMIWFNDGVHHSLRVAFGPQLRFLKDDIKRDCNAPEDLLDYPSHNGGIGLVRVCSLRSQTIAQSSQSSNRR